MCGFKRPTALLVPARSQRTNISLVAVESGHILVSGKNVGSLVGDIDKDNLSRLQLILGHLESVLRSAIIIEVAGLNGELKSVDREVAVGHDSQAVRVRVPGFLPQEERVYTSNQKIDGYQKEAWPSQHEEPWKQGDTYPSGPSAKDVLLQSVLTLGLGNGCLANLAQTHVTVGVIVAVCKLNFRMHTARSSRRQLLRLLQSPFPGL